MTRGRTTDGGPLVVYGQNPVRELLACWRAFVRVAVFSGHRGSDLADAARRRGVRCEFVERAVLDRLAGTTSHQGVVALAPPFGWTALGTLLEPDVRGLLFLDGIQDPRNLGAILRSARAAGIGGVVLPQDRSVGMTPVVVAASAGTVFGLALARVPNLVRALEGAREAGFWSVGLVAEGGQDLFAADLPARPALVIGGEGEGLRPLVRRTCDFAVTIPMAPGVESLNASVAAAIACFELRRRGLLG
jgi:23S rRNA (guanosine2251-2'-O)-methyltransferase